MARKTQRPSTPTKGQGLGPAGANPLFFGVLFAVVLGCGAAALAGGAEWLGANGIYRMGIGAIATALAYILVTALWLAWHQRVFKRLSALGASVELPDQEAAEEVSARDRDIADFMDTTTAAMDELGKRIQALEGDPGD